MQLSPRRSMCSKMPQMQQIWPSFALDCKGVQENAQHFLTNHRGTVSGQKSTLLRGVGVQGHFKRECLKLKNNKNYKNQVGNDKALAKVYAVGHAGTNPDSNVVDGALGS
ncbi:hypothetical protein Tco_0565566 [Tanacetum coccineum]